MPKGERQLQVLKMYLLPVAACPTHGHIRIDGRSARNAIESEGRGRAIEEHLVNVGVETLRYGRLARLYEL